MLKDNKFIKIINYCFSKLLEEREAAEQKCVAMEKKYADMVSQLNSILRTDDVLSPSLEQLVAKVSPTSSLVNTCLFISVKTCTLQVVFTKLRYLISKMYKICIICMHFRRIVVI